MGEPGSPTGSLTVDLAAVNKAAAALDAMARNAPGIGSTADETTGNAAKALAGWATAGALTAALQQWHTQVGGLVAMLNRDAAAMHGTAANYNLVNAGTVDLFPLTGP